MLSQFITLSHKFDDSTYRTLLSKFATNMHLELTEFLTSKLISQIHETFAISPENLFMVNDIAKYLFNNAAGDRKFDKVRELLGLNKLSESKLKIFEECFNTNSQEIYNYLKDNGMVNHNLVHEIKSEVLLPLSSSDLPIKQSQLMNDKLSFYFSEDVHNPKTVMNFKCKGNNDAAERMEEFNFVFEKADLQTLFEETEIIKKKLDRIVASG
jgi:hypothetical protein